ncbi:Crp/Fnr family transcriptional regulator [Cupriavidus basilensis]|uniref:cAMP-binding protein-catabolite gene activator and regulatory subunit of cAMP-dependent protein kinase n=1 Tax=Cupriavidus basilensis TaxID=68895 RepID=A0A0C4YID1_9BURK|nr:Crp/Fnr family transcriptional regulator [Cupriavidus basilensis]AJG21614.1 cAMP-binding protein - catabolite gene activator and regulatory subunit of cAMP-dependent protein kinase [Cupriavidus basilensis]
MISQRSDLHVNHVLGALPRKDWDSLSSHLELVRMRAGQLLTDSGQRIHHVYFPTTAIVSMLSLLEDGATVEIAAIGNEGLVGIPVLTGGDTMPCRVEVRTPGFAYRLAAATLKQEFTHSPAIQRVTLLYVQAVLTQIAQTAVCNRHHSLNKQLCRWLLLALDRMASNELVITQQVIANMLGVRREGVTEAAGKLEDLGLIQHSRGHITVLDRHGLEAHSCECYKLVKREFDRLLPALASA